MSDDLRAWLAEEDGDEAEALLPEEDEPLVEGKERRKLRVQHVSPTAFFVFSMMLFFVACWLSLLVLLLTGRIYVG